MTLALLSAVFFLGAFYLQGAYLLPSGHVAFLSYQESRKITAVEGLIDSDVQLRPTAFGTKQVFELRVSRLEFEGRWQKAKGRVLVDFFPLQERHYGEHIILRGGLHKAFSDPAQRSSYQQYLEDHKLFFIFSVAKKQGSLVLSSRNGHWWMGLAFAVKHRIEAVLARHLEPREAGMVQAMILGDRSFLPKDIYAVFARTGTAHVLAISGMNMTIIAAIVLFILKVMRLSRRWQFILTILFLFAYAFLSGWSASVVRSVFMAAVILSGFCLEHETDTMNSLGFAAMVLLLCDPLNMFDVGFQLSFACVGVIVWLYPLTVSLNTRIKGRIAKHITQALAVSLIAWAGTIGLIAYYFGMISPVAIIANIFIIPLADLVVALGLIVGTAGLCCDPLAAIMACSLKAVFNLTLVLTAWFAQIPGGCSYIQPLRIWQVFVYYLVLMIVYLIVRINPSIFRKDHDPFHSIG